MTITYPSNLDSFTPLTPGVGGSRVSDSVGGRTHAQFHNDADSAIIALETKVGITGSADTTTLDYKLSGVTGTDKAASKTGTETLTNKTLTTPTITTPTISSFTNANHTHADAANGGQINPNTALSAAAGVPVGGTGKVSLTAYALLAGGTTSTGAVQSLAGLGTTGQVLTSNGAGALPTFQPLTTGTSYKTVIPKPNVIDVGGGVKSVGSTSSTTGYFGQIVVPVSIVVNKITVYCSGTGSTTGFKVGLYNEDGQTLLGSVTLSLSSSGFYSGTFGSAITLNAGIYYTGIVNDGTASSTTIQTWSQAASANWDPFSSVSGKPIIQGTATVTAYTLPATFTPGSLTYTTGCILMCRLDN